jgi:hypothetical protein
MSETPETDKLAVGAIGFYSCATVPADFARRLERERDEAVCNAASLLRDFRICSQVAAELEFKYEKARERLRRKKK